jgi:hypothetical protein
VADGWLPALAVLVAVGRAGPRGCHMSLERMTGIRRWCKRTVLKRSGGPWGVEHEHSPAGRCPVPAAGPGGRRGTGHDSLGVGPPWGRLRICRAGRGRRQTEPGRTRTARFAARSTRPRHGCGRSRTHSFLVEIDHPDGRVVEVSGKPFRVDEDSGWGSPVVGMIGRPD